MYCSCYFRHSASSTCDLGGFKRIDTIKRSDIDEEWRWAGYCVWVGYFGAKSLVVPVYHLITVKHVHTYMYTDFFTYCDTTLLRNGDNVSLIFFQGESQWILSWIGYGQLQFYRQRGMIWLVTTIEMISFVCICLRVYVRLLYPI